MKMLIAAGGTGGHIFPAITVAEFLKEQDPQNEIVLVGSKQGLESEIFPKSGFAYETLSVGKIKGQGFVARVKTFLRLPRVFLQSLLLMTKIHPDFVLGIGGYSSGPVMLAATFFGIHRGVMEPNAIPGLTNRLLGHWVNRVFVAFPEASRFFSAKKVRVTGTPVRKSLRVLGEKKMTLPAKAEFTIAVIGGSQGALSLNKAMVALLPRLQASGKKFRVIHQTGSQDYQSVKAAYAATSISHEVSPFIDDMEKIYREADLAVCRSGASTVAELIQTVTPSILVPYPYAADDHQRFNALSVVDFGGAEMLANQDLEKLADRIFYYEEHRDVLKAMSQKLFQRQKVPAVEQLVQECLELCHG